MCCAFSEGQVDVEQRELVVENHTRARRVDLYLAGRFRDYSRSFIKQLIDESCITVNGRIVKPSYTPKQGDRITARIPVLRYDRAVPEDLPLDIIFEDDWIVVVNKPPDMVVHPCKGHQTGTLVNALLYRYERLSEAAELLRPGIVHRLDRDTSGVILVVKDQSVHDLISRQFRDREVHKEYVAVCEGTIEFDSDVIDAPLGRHPVSKEKMSVRSRQGKAARTTYEVVERVAGFTVVRCFPESGRTHQIRVHLQHIGHPIAADSLYGHRDAVYLSELTGEESYPSEEPVLDRQALHARRLTIKHPVSGQEVTFEAEIPADMMRLIEVLRDL